MAGKTYIEREAVLEYIDKSIPRMKRSKGGKHPISIEAVRDFIATFDTADVVPVEHGYWKESANLDECFWICSECRFCSVALAAPNLYQYCPNCGARMDGDADA